MNHPSTTPTQSRAQQMLNPHAVLSGLIGLIIAATVAMIGLSLAIKNGFGVAISIVGLVCFAVLLLAHVRGWRYSAHAMVIAAVVFTIAGNPAELTLHQLSFTILIPSVLAAMFLPWYWTVGAFGICLLGVGGQSDFAGLLFQPGTMLMALIIVIGAAAAGAFGRSAQHTAEDRASLLATEKARVEAQAADLADANMLLEHQLDQQQQLLDLVSTLETPAVQLADGVLLVPLVGPIDSRRAQNLTEKLLVAVYDQRARHVILDVAGVALIDTGVAHALLGTVRAIRLLGCDVIMSGIAADVALTLTQLGVPLGELRSVRSPQEALSSIGEMRLRSAPSSRNN